MRMDCETAREHLDAWALGALDAYDARALESHLASCQQCLPLADDARQHAALVGMAVPLHASSSTLKARVMASARALTDISRAGVSKWWRTAAAAAAVFSIGTLTWGVVMQMRAEELGHDRSLMAASATEQAGALAAVHTEVADLASARSSLDQQIQTQNAVLDVALRPDVEWTSLEGTGLAPGASGRCVWSRTQALGAFIADNLPIPPSGQAYNMWLVYENAWINGGSFNVDAEGRGHLILHRIWGDKDQGSLIGFAVTLENSREPILPSGELALASPPQ